MKRWTLSLLASFVAASGASYADEPPSWRPFTVCSATERFCAEVAPVTETDEPWTAEWRLTVTEHDSPTELWSSSLRHDGYKNAILSDDGTTFVTVNHWYYADSPVVRIFRADGRRSLDGDAFEVPSWKLQKTPSHRLWLTSDQQPYMFAGVDRLRVITIDKRSHLIDLLTGELVNGN